MTTGPTPPDYETLCRRALEQLPEQADLYRRGKTALGPLIGHVMRATRGAANPHEVHATLLKLLTCC